MQSRYRAVIFDFDYTLVDSSRGVVECFNHALGRMGLPTATTEAVCATIGQTLSEGFVRVVGEEQRQRTPEFLGVFRERADEVMNAMTELLPATREALRHLRACGLRLAIVSLKFRYRIEGYLAAQGLLDLFEVVVGAEDVPAPKPDPAGILAALGRLGVSREEALYVGDSVVDAEAAHNAGLDFAAVLSGVTPAAAFAALPKVAILRDVGELPGLACPQGVVEAEADGTR